MRDRLSKEYIRGQGIEIGGLHCPLPVQPGVKVAYVDHLPMETLRQNPDVTPVENPIIVDDAERLDHIEDRSCDFVIANHVLEHCHDPIGTLKTWHRVLKQGGIVYAAIPEKTQTFDRDREVTTLEHLIKDHEEGYDGWDHHHYREWHRVVDKLEGKVLEDRVMLDLEGRANIHFHVWDREAQAKLMAYMFTFFEPLEGQINGAEIIWILKKL